MWAPARAPKAMLYAGHLPLSIMGKGSPPHCNITASGVDDIFANVVRIRFQPTAHGIEFISVQFVNLVFHGRLRLSVAFAAGRRRSRDEVSKVLAKICRSCA